MTGRADPRDRNTIRTGMAVEVIRKEDQKSGRRTRGIVSAILTNSRFHPHGIKVRLTTGIVGRVAEIIQQENGSDSNQTDKK